MNELCLVFIFVKFFHIIIDFIYIVPAFREVSFRRRSEKIEKKIGSKRKPCIRFKRERAELRESSKDRVGEREREYKYRPLRPILIHTPQAGA